MNAEVFIDSNVFVYQLDASDPRKQIVAAALLAGCTRLLTEDLQHGQRIDSLTIRDPFR
jgi:predicted nucleic acid-binding protein